MYTIIICTIIGILIGLRMAYKDIYYKNDVFFYLANSFLGLFIGGSIGLLISIALPNKTQEVTKSYIIESLKDNNELNGSFFIGSGSVEGKFVYLMYLKSDNGFRFNQLNADKVLIKYTNSTPKLIKNYEVPTGDFINKFSIPIGMKTNYVIEIPKGSIKNNYILDLEN